MFANEVANKSQALVRLPLMSLNEFRSVLSKQFWERIDPRSTNGTSDKLRVECGQNAFPCVVRNRKMV